MSRTWLDVDWRRVGLIVERYADINEKMRSDLMLGIEKLAVDADEENGESAEREVLMKPGTCPHCNRSFRALGMHLRYAKKCRGNY